MRRKRKAKEIESSSSNSSSSSDGVEHAQLDTHAIRQLLCPPAAANAVLAAAAAAADAAASHSALLLHATTSQAQTSTGVAEDTAAAPPEVSSAALNAELSTHLQQTVLPQVSTDAADAAAPPAAAAASLFTINRRGTKKSRDGPSAGSTSTRSVTRLETFSEWLQERHIDPFTCARRCDSVLRLALLVEQYGRWANATSFAFAGACVLQAAFQECKVESPDSLSSWQRLLAQPSATAAVSRQSDSLWYHVRRDGAAFCEGVPTKARDDTLTALAIVAAIAPHDPSMKQLVNAHIATGRSM